MAVSDRAVAQAEFEAADQNLRKPMGFTSLLFLSIGAIIGSGWLFGSLDAASVAGPAAIISWAVGGVFVIFISLTYAEQAGMLPRTGAIVRYPLLTHGGWTAWLVGWTYWLSAITVPAIEAEAVVKYVAGQAPGANLQHTAYGVSGILSWPNGILFFLGLMVFFFLLNFFGIRLMSETNRWVTWWKIIIPSLTAIFMFTILRGSNFSSLSFGSAKGFAPYGTGVIFEAMSTSGVVFAYLGFRQALDYAGEARNPQRHVPLATVLGVAITTVIYVGLQIGLIGAVHWSKIGIHAGDWSGLLNSSMASSPLVDALRAAGVAWLATYAWFLLVDAGVSPSGTGWIYLGTAGRTTYGLSVNRNLPKAFQWPNRWGIPWLSMLVALLIGCVFVIPAPSWYLLVGFITSTTVLTYIMGGIGLPVMRKFGPNLHRPFRLPWMWFWAPIGFMAAWEVVYWSGYGTLTDVYGAVFIGMPLFTWYYARNRGWFETAAQQAGAIAVSVIFLAAWVYILVAGGWVARIKPPAAGSWGFIVYYVVQCAAVLFFCAGMWLFSNRTGRLHTERGMWFIVSVLALLPVSYYGQFGPEGSNAPLVFPWGTLVAIGVGLIAFGWGVLSGFNTDEFQEIVRTAEAKAGNAVASPGTEAGGEAAPA